MFAALRVIVILATAFIVTLALLPVQLVAIAAFPKLAGWLPMVWHRLMLTLMGVRIHIRGEITRNRPLMIAANHVSWSDIMVLGSALPCSFIAKNDMEKWPIFGWLAKLQRTIFVARDQPRLAGQQAHTIAGRMMAGDAMVLFPEGTTSCGNFILPFKSSLFGAPQGIAKSEATDAVFVQPVAIAYTRVHGMPLGRYLMPEAAWPGDIDLGPHLFNFLKKGAFDVELVFGEPLAFTPQTDRKRFTTEMERRVRAMVNEAMRGHDGGVLATQNGDAVADYLHSAPKTIDKPKFEQAAQ